MWRFSGIPSASFWESLFVPFFLLEVLLLARSLLAPDSEMVKFTRLPAVLIEFLFFAFLLLGLFLLARNLLRDLGTVRRNDWREAVVTEVRTERSGARNRTHIIGFCIERDGSKVSGRAEYAEGIMMNLAGSLPASHYREGEKVIVLCAEDGSYMLFGAARGQLLNDAAGLVFCLAVCVICIISTLRALRKDSDG